jgi:hypothetical protein
LFLQKNKEEKREKIFPRFEEVDVLFLQNNFVPDLESYLHYVAQTCTVWAVHQNDYNTALLFLSPKVKKENPNVKNIKARLYCAGSKSDTPLHTVKLDSVKFVIFPAIPADGTACWISVEVWHLVSRVSDPDPDGIRIQSGQWIRIRIHILNPDPDPGGQKWPTKLEKNQEVSCFQVLDVLFGELKTSSVTWTSFMEA